MARLKYRLALDVGANSLGWCVYALNDQDEAHAVKRLGVRIFSDGRTPKTLASNAADRRAARQARRRRDRVLKRRQRLLQQLVRFGLMPDDETQRKAIQEVDPYALRACGLDEPLTPHELGRAIYHLARKRGFQSSRKDRKDKDRKDAEAVKEEGKVNSAISALRERIAHAGCRTVGEYLAAQHAERKPVRGRRAADGGYVLYMQRGMVEDEFDQLWMAQRRHHPTLLTDAARDTLRDTILFQRRLKPVLPGRCQFEPDALRAPLCSPLQQRFRILQELNNLRVRDGIGQRPLTLAERDVMRDALLHSKESISFANLAKLAGLKNAKQFNLESEKRKGLKGDSTSASFAAVETLGQDWHRLDDMQREAMALLVERTDQEDRLVAALVALPDDLAVARDAMRPHPHEQALLESLRQLPFRLDDARARRVARIILPDDFGSLSYKALARIVPELEREVVTYDVAVQRAGYVHHSQLHTGEIFDRLPYYGEVLRGFTSPMPTAKVADENRWGRIPNPTVHIGLNQLRQLVNALSKRYGPPSEVVVELTREFGLSGQRRREIEKEQTDNQARNERYNDKLRNLGQAPNRTNREKLRLWEELGRDDAMDRCCVYSGERLNQTLLFSDEVEIDHILPFSKSLHDGIGNKVLCMRQPNRDKGNRTPHAAFSHSPGRYRWDEIEERASRLPARKALLFRESALDDFLGDRDFLDRHLTDTAYFGRAAKQYLSYVCHKDRVWVSSGRLTGMLRGKWGLNALLSDDSRKNRNDHRHHAVDAAVIGMCTRSLIQRMANAAAEAERRGENRLLERLELPWPTFRDDLKANVDKIVVSHRPDHGPEAALHNDTNYGWRGEPDKRGTPLVGHRIPLEAIKSAADTSKIADSRLQEKLEKLLAPLSGKAINAALHAFSQRTGIRRVLVEERYAVIPICDRRSGEPYRYVRGDGNYCYDIYCRDDGRWDGEIVSRYDANRPNFETHARTSRTGFPLRMRLRRDDMLALERDGQRLLYRVAQLSEGKIILAPHSEANVDTRSRDKDDAFKYLQLAPSRLKNARARIVGVDMLGYVNDPGFAD